MHYWNKLIYTKIVHYQTKFAKLFWLNAKKSLKMIQQKKVDQVGYLWTFLSSGSRGSGWIFTESSLKAFQSGDSSNASQFDLDISNYLTDAVCIGGNEEFPSPNGNRNEKGHRGHDCAKITTL